MEASGFPWPNGVHAAVLLTFDVDAESGVLWEYPETVARLGIMSHQEYAIRAGLPRLLRLLARHGLRATFFVPGYTAERHPDAVRAILDGGHEVALHGYLHEVVTQLEPAQEEVVLLRGREALARVTGEAPQGWRAPMWEVNYGTPALLARHGFAYDSSLMDDDLPYLLAAGESAERTLVEIPPHWSRDDGEQYAWLPWIWDTATIESPQKVAVMWELDVEAALCEGSCVTFTMHPCLSGRPGRALALEPLFERLAGAPEIWVPSCGELARHVAGLSLQPVRHEPPPLAPGDLPSNTTSSEAGVPGGLQ